MARESLYIIHGTGPDRVGLVGAIAKPIADAGGNIVDVRQDVLHGLFTVFVVVDLAVCELRVAELEEMVRQISEDTELTLKVDDFVPIPRSLNKQSMLMVLIGRDRPGVTALLTETLGKYRINIESAQMIAREGVFLVELLTDVSSSALPLPNVQAALTQSMTTMGMRTMFQTDNVFIKKKRVVVFEATTSLLGRAAIAELMAQATIAPSEVAAAYPVLEPQQVLRQAARYLDGVPSDVLGEVAAALRPSPGTVELVQTLKTMGYVTVLATPSFDVLAARFKVVTGLDDVLSIPLAVDDDSRLCIGELGSEEALGRSPTELVAELSRVNGVSSQDVVVVSDQGEATSSGIRVEPDLSAILCLFNARSLSRTNLLGLIGAVGLPRL